MSVRTISRFYDDAGYIKAMKQHIEAYWAAHGRSSKLMLSFHGIPQAGHDQGDPYPEECRHTAKLLAAALGLAEADYLVSFQSRFGKAKWVGPSTQDLFDSLPKQGTTTLDVFCPGFAADCLETSGRNRHRRARAVSRRRRRTVSLYSLPQRQPGLD